MGNVVASIAPYSQISQQWPPKSAFKPERDVPDLTGKVAIVTGANSGIGFHTAKELLRKNAKVYLACRNVKKGEEAVESIQKDLANEAAAAATTTTVGQAVVLELDLGDLASVKKASTEILNKEERIDILINNAGVMIPPFELLTKQGYDLQFGTNVLGHYYFTVLLMPALERSTLHHKEKARIVNLSSAIHYMAPGKTGIEWNALKGGETRNKAIKRLGIANYWRLYGISKMGNVLMTNFLARDFGDKIVTCSLNPGGIRTNLQQHISPIPRAFLNASLHPTALGAYTSLFAATTVPATEINGKFFQPWARFGRADTRASNVEVQEQLKKWLDEQIAEFERSAESS